MRHDAVIGELRAAVFKSRGELDPETRRAIAGGGGPEALGAYVGKIAHEAYRITDADVEALRSAGWSDEALFEATVSAAVGAGMLRLYAGLAAIREAAP